ncbi:MAG: M12 family metallo-peptidase [Thiolinea sp.]
MENQLSMVSAARKLVPETSSGMVVSLPLPDGSFAKVEVIPEQVVDPKWTKEYSDMKAWTVISQDKRVISGVMDKTPLGIHAMLQLRNGDTVFIDPHETVKGNRTYLSYSKRNNRAAFASAMKGFRCGKTEQDKHEDSLAAKILTTAYQSDSGLVYAQKVGQTLNTYRLALATTAEFTALNGGATTTNSRLFTLIARVNQIYLRDLTVKFNLVGGTKIIQTNATTDGYTNQGVNATTGEPLASIENTTVLNKILTSTGYDIGHVITTGTQGGWGTPYSPCSSAKARGTSSMGALGSAAALEAAAIDMLAHELGHQFSARHTFNASTGGACGSFNGNLTRDSTDAVEPGAGSTIMSYAGLCPGNNIIPVPTSVGSNAEAMFHAHSLNLMTTFAHNGAGNNCAAKPALYNPTGSTTINSNPVISAMPATVTIPARTPFTLPIVKATDANNDPLSYAWDQYNVGGTAANKNQDKINSALIRSRLPQYGNSSRNIPNLADLLAGRNVDGEYLPITTRALNFRLVVRDNRGGITQGAYQVNVRNTGAAFRVTSASIPAGQAATLRWDVAGTNISPINCANVNISLINGSGTAYANLGTYANNGYAVTTIKAPATLQANTRAKVACSNNIFFAISSTNPAVAAP